MDLTSNPTLIGPRSGAAHQINGQQLRRIQCRDELVLSIRFHFNYPQNILPSINITSPTDDKVTRRISNVLLT